MDLTKFETPIQKANSFTDFLKSLVGTKLQNLLDASSFARLYIGNKYGFSEPDQNDKQALVSDLMSLVTDYINFRKITPLRAKLDATDDEDRKRPEVVAYNKQRTNLLKQIMIARREGNTALVAKLEKEQGSLVNPSSYSKNMEDMQVLVKQFHNSPLTLADVTPSPNDSVEDKQRFQKAEQIFNKLKSLG